jgi:hypothetical protein
MVESASSEMQERLRALCKQITVAEEIDPEIQEELMTHVEDRFNGYLHGKDPITEEDAFLLVREHFGKPAVVKELLQHTHVQEATVSLGRRLAAISAVSLGYTAAVKILAILWSTVLVWVALRTEPESRICGYLWTAWSMVSACSLAPLLWFVVWRWSRAVDAGSRPRFTRWSPARLCLLLLGLVLALYIVPSVRFDGIELGIPQSAVLATLITVMGLGVVWIAVILQSMAWLWWCDRPPRTKRALSYATLTWAFVGACGAMPVATLTISVELPNDFFTLLKLITVDANLWSASASPLNTVYDLFTMAAWIFIVLTPSAYAGRVFYWLARRYGKKFVTAVAYG